MKVGDVCKFNTQEIMGYEFIEDGTIGVIFKKEWFKSEATWVYHVYFANQDLTLWFRHEEINTTTKVTIGEANEQAL